jgi:hypothetical protein
VAAAGILLNRLLVIYGRNVEKNTAASLVVSTAEVINFGKGKIYMDAVSGTAGTTQSPILGWTSA